MDELNRDHSTIKFMANWSAEEVAFVDTRVCLSDCLMETDVHIKATDTCQHLPTDSCHPRRCKTAIPCEQALQLRRIRSEEDNVHKRCEELKSYLSKTGYEKHLLHDEVQRALSIPRETCLRTKKDQENTL